MGWKKFPSRLLSRSVCYSVMSDTILSFCSSFRFFTTDIVGKKYYCPCKPKCEDNHREAEWNGRNIAKVVKKDRPVHIFIEVRSVCNNFYGMYMIVCMYMCIHQNIPKNPQKSKSLSKKSILQLALCWKLRGLRWSVLDFFHTSGQIGWVLNRLDLFWTLSNNSESDPFLAASLRMDWIVLAEGGARPVPIELGNFWASYDVWSNFLRF